MKTFEHWMEEETIIADKTYIRKEIIDSHSRKVAAHVWQQCSESFVLDLDMFLTKLMLLSDFRAIAMIKEFKQELITMVVSNAVSASPEEEKPTTQLSLV